MLRIAVFHDHRVDAIRLLTKSLQEWLDATYYNVRTEECRITLGKRGKSRAAVKSYRDLLNQYLFITPSPNSAGPDGKPCDPASRGVLQRRHIVAAGRSHCGKEFMRNSNQVRLITISTRKPKCAKTDELRPIPKLFAS